jgi:hypothetical protein
MNELDKVYLEILYHGLVGIRNASRNGDLEYCKAESEHLHEVPSLVGETNRHRHIYYATGHRAAYLEWIAKNHREDVREWVEVWYAGAWKELDRILGIGPSSH